MCFEFPVNLTGKLTRLLLTGQSWHMLKPGTQVGAQSKDFGAVSQADLSDA